jgi:CheY-like chemotaxis protein
VLNARDAMPGGGQLTIETANVDLDHSYVGHHPETRSGAYAMLAVTDSGSGMSEDVRRRAFEPFFTTKPAGAGSGLGLSMVYGIVRQSGGNVWMFSEPGQGTSVKIYLPRIDAAHPLEAPAPSPAVVVETTSSGRESILLVEDDDAVRALTRQWLVRYGYNVIEAETSDDALQLGARADLHIDLLLTDVVMPGLDGTKVAAHLRGLRPSLRIVYMSGYPDTALGATRSLADADAFVQKPFTATVLAGRIRQALDRQ